MSLIQKRESVSVGDIGDNIDEFAILLGRPTRLHLRGRDAGRCRALVTLLHGNEPSGIKALHRLLREGFEPEVDIYCYIVALEAALTPPVFTHRMVPGKRDYNRCFKSPFEVDEQGRVCRELLADLASLAPEAVVDMHNTSGEGPSFAVARQYNEPHEKIASVFTDRLIVTDIRLGAIMETSTPTLPVVTVECGGADEDSSDRIAMEGLTRYFSLPDLYVQEEHDRGLEILHDPVRVELAPDAGLTYGETPDPACDLTLKVDIEHHNFGVTPPHTFLGWKANGDANVLNAFNPQQANQFDQFYYVHHGRLYTRVPQKMFMITTNAAIAKSDCLWYVVRE